jgi:hypothetical protein
MTDKKKYTKVIHVTESNHKNMKIKSIREKRTFSDFTDEILELGLESFKKKKVVKKNDKKTE